MGREGWREEHREGESRVRGKEVERKMRVEWRWRGIRKERRGWRGM